MSDTPRTDANLEEMVSRTSIYTPSVEFTRQLERELAEANKRIAELEKELNTAYSNCIDQENRALRAEKRIAELERENERLREAAVSRVKLIAELQHRLSEKE